MAAWARKFGKNRKSGFFCNFCKLTASGSSRLHAHAYCSDIGGILKGTSTYHPPMSVFADVPDTAAPSLEAPKTQIGAKLAPFNPTNPDCVILALDMLKLGEADVLYDLGCGDGRFLIQGIKQCSRGVGIEYESLLCDRAREGVLQAGCADKVAILHENVIDCDFTSATAIFVYLVPAGIAAIRPALEAALERGARIVTYVFSIPGIVPQRVEKYKQSTTLYLYRK